MHIGGVKRGRRGFGGISRLTEYHPRKYQDETYSSESPGHCTVLSFEQSEVSARTSNLSTDGYAFNFNRVQLAGTLALSGFEDWCFEIEM
jgi:hypothetical protein